MLAPGGWIVKTPDAILAAIDSSGESQRSVSLRLGRSPNYIASVLEQSRRKGGSVNSGTLASIADACGYDVALVPHGQELPSGSMRIDAPDRP